MSGLYGKPPISSVKNMILIEEDKESKDALLLGKMGDHIFNLEVNFPLFPRLAIAIINSCFYFFK